MIISLTGFMGCGKSSVGRRLSELLCCPFMDLDDAIETGEGRTIPEIFATDGETAFRRMELERLKMVIDSSSNAGDNIVLALGGGTVMTPECAKSIHEHTYCIYLRASVDTLVNNLSDEAEGRPMLQSPDGLRARISELMSLRSATYEATAVHTIDTDGRTPDEIAADIKTRCQER